MVTVLCVDISGLDEAGYGLLYERASAERQARADRYLRREDAFRCVTAGALLRYAVKIALNRDTFPLEKNPDGKPFIPDAPDFHFNLSHSGQFVVIAYGDTPVGVDVEQVRAEGMKPGIAQRFFTPDEQSYATDAEKFYEIWSKKESYIKYHGIGLRYPLESFSVLSPELATQFQTIPIPGYSLAVFAPNTEKKIHFLPLSQLLFENEVI